MAYSANILLGRISKVHGYDGTVIVRLENSFIENIPEIESVFLEIEGRPVPFFISSLEYPGADLIKLRFDGYKSHIQIREFTGCKVYLTSEREENNAINQTGNLTGYNIISGHGHKLGKISRIVETPGQLLLSIDAGSGKEILIPFHEDLIEKVDKKKKIIYMDLPEGLIDLN
jgi:16S rRNA processing protein RimM